MRKHAMVLALLVAALSAASAAEVGPAVEAAPQAKESRNQTWASAAWCEGAKCWLVVWREGYLNERTGDIWCARVSADGKALDPSGIRLTAGEVLRDRPRVASDGKGFLVVWEEMTPGKDWDVFAAAVPSEGGPAPGKPLLLAGGEHNQCRPDVAFAGGNYHVLCMAYEGEAYSLWGMRVSPAGKPVGDKPVVVAAVPPGKSGNPSGSQNPPVRPASVTLPAIAANAKGELLVGFHVRDGQKLHYLGWRPLDPATGQPGGTAPTAAGEKNSPRRGDVWTGRERPLALAMGPDGAVSVSVDVQRVRPANDIIVCRLSKTGELLGLQEGKAGPLGISAEIKPISARFAVACTGNSYLAVGEVLSPSADRKKNADGTPNCWARVVGWRISPDGKPEGEAIAVTGEPGRECVLPSIAAGPEGACLVVYSELRGPDDVKVLARIVK